MSESGSDAEKSRDLSDHPGWFGWGYGDGRGGFILGIHADWPAYPCSPGGMHGLFDLAQFPEGTRFEPMDDIDRCVLFNAYNYDPKKPHPPRDPWSRDAFQVAIWHEDLLRLRKEGLISGVTPISHREWELRRRIEMGWKQGVRYFTKDDQGNSREISLPSLPEPPVEEDFWDGDPYTYPAFEEDGNESPLTITAAGWEVVTQQLSEQVELPESLPDLRKLLDNDLYDHAVREVGIAVESALREVVGNDDGFGQRLVGEFIDHLHDEVFVYNTMLKIYRLRLRTFFKFVRNPHAHHKISLTRPHALSLTAHALHLLSDIQQFGREEEQQ
ncbi:hypothetical protein ACH4Q6_05965 [Streptomyces lydicus]|uniref:hypothetical protein n=1 Tax=Streptomyces lydicus TaxID=47763 RepID=UPI0037A4604D